jgi:hypothetical protein
MRLGGERVGPRGMIVLGASGLIGLGLAPYGYGHGIVLGGSQPRFGCNASDGLAAGS